MWVDAMLIVSLLQHSVTDQTWRYDVMIRHVCTVIP